MFIQTFSPPAGANPFSSCRFLCLRPISEYHKKCDDWVSGQLKVQTNPYLIMLDTIEFCENWVAFCWPFSDRWVKSVAYFPIHKWNLGSEAGAEHSGRTSKSLIFDTIDTTDNGIWCQHAQCEKTLSSFHFPYPIDNGNFLADPRPWSAIVPGSLYLHDRWFERFLCRPDPWHPICYTNQIALLLLSKPHHHLSVSFTQSAKIP